MKNTKKILIAVLLVAVAALFTGCPKSNPFTGHSYAYSVFTVTETWKFEDSTVTISTKLLGFDEVITGPYEYTWDDTTLTVKYSANTFKTYEYKFSNKLLLLTEPGSSTRAFTQK